MVVIDHIHIRLVSAYKEAFPSINHEKAKGATKNHLDKWKDDFGLGTEFCFLLCLQVFCLHCYTSCRVKYCECIAKKISAIKSNQSSTMIYALKSYFKLLEIALCEFFKLSKISKKLRRYNNTMTAT